MPIKILVDTNLIEAACREVATYQGIQGNPTPCHVWHWSDEIPSDAVRAKEVKNFWGIIKEKVRTQEITFFVSPMFFLEANERPMFGSQNLGVREQLDLQTLEIKEFNCSYYGKLVADRKAMLRQQIGASNNARLKQVVKHFGSKNLQDSVHFTSAEMAGLDIILTMDLKFVRNFEAQKNTLNSSLKVCSPSEFCAQHSISESNQIRNRTYGTYDYSGVQLTSVEMQDYLQQRADVVKV